MSDRSPHILRHEPFCFLVLGLISLGVIIQTGSVHRVHLSLLAGALALIATARFDQVKKTSLSLKIRLGMAYGVMLWIYTAVADLVPLMKLSTYDHQLLEIDRFLWGETPALIFTPRPWLTELMSFGYLSYQFYIHGSMILNLLINPAQASRMFGFIFPAFTLGVIGYFIVPAVGPWKAYPDQLTQPLNGWLITDINAFVVAQGSSVYDVFPSLHVLGTLVMLDHDRVYRRSWFRVMVPISVVLIISTLYLRYHYAIDLLAGLVIFLFVRRNSWKWVTRSSK